jgi:hypothetical protein
MLSSDDGSTHPPTNAFDPRFLELLGERDEPPTAREADVAGPWRVEPTGEPADQTFSLFRPGEVPGKHRPLAVFTEPHLALLAAAVLPGVGQDPAYRLRKDPDPEGYAIESRPAWAAVVGHLAVFDETLIAAMNVLHSLLTTPESLANLLEAAGAEALHHAGTLLATRIGSPPQ